MTRDRAFEQSIRTICAAFGNSRGRLIDIVCRVQREHGHVSSQALDLIAAGIGTERVEVERVVSFYSFLSDQPEGRVVIRLCNDVIDRMHGSERVAAALEQALGIRFGETTDDGQISLRWTACIGMSDQGPAALVNDVVVTKLSTDAALAMVRQLRTHGDPQRLVRTFGDGNNGHELVQSMVVNNIRRAGPVIFDDLDPGSAIRKSTALHPAEVIRAIKTARLRGRGGAGFPTGMKWQYTRSSDAEQRYVICNADEGEPGTFKDRVVLTERAPLLFEGMTIAGYAIGATKGIVYLRAEYAYLRELLEQQLATRRERGLLGREICGKEGFDFDIRIQMGAGAYICGEETALISSAEGGRGDPKNRPPFPAQEGYRGYPSSVNNVETLCCVARILDKGAGWFNQLGTERSSGTKLFSVSGDCRSPGVFELSFGTTLRELLELVGAEDAAAVQVGGPSGKMVGPADYDRAFCFDDLATGGSIMVFGPGRDLLEVASDFMEFFIDESCGYCTPCRVGNLLLRERLEKVRAGLADEADLDYLRELGETVKVASRCGLGQGSPNPILSTLDNFQPLYKAKLQKSEGALLATFDIQGALEGSRALTGRDSLHFRREKGGAS